MTPGWYLITQTSVRCFQLHGYDEAEARNVFAATTPKKGQVVQLVRFRTHFSWCVVKEKRA